VYRIDADAIVISEVFEKKSQRTPRGRDRDMQGEVQATRQDCARRGVIEVDSAEQKRLEAAGWKAGDVAEFLQLTSEEADYVELKLALGAYLRELRRSNRWTQTQLAHRLGSSQSRVAKMESADGSVSVDLLLKSLFSVGATPKDVGRVIGAI
jgi:ribosome-binding protein aMBF1 (putative translation factor)